MEKVKLTTRESHIDDKGRVSFAYPEHYTQQQRGFTPSGSAKLNFGTMRRISKSKAKRIVSDAEEMSIERVVNTTGRMYRRLRSRIPKVLLNIYPLPKSNNEQKKKPLKKNKLLNTLLGLAKSLIH